MAGFNNRSIASYNLVFSIVIIFLLMCPTATRCSQLALLQSERVLSRHIQKVYRAQHLLANLRRIHTNSTSIILCTKLVTEGYRLLRTVHSRMNGTTRFDSDTSFFLQTTLSAASTHLRTCTRTLEEAGNDEVGPFGSLLREMETIGGDCYLESLALGALDRATLPMKKPTQESAFPKVHSAGDVLSTLERVPTERRLIVAQDGSGDFSTVSAAIAAAPVGATDYFLIIVKEGIYNENVVVPVEKPFLVLSGAGKKTTVITGSRSNAAGWNTYDSATVAIHGHNFIGYNISFENSAGPHGGQAVALLCNGNLSVFYQCRFMGYQDTLYAHSWLQFYRECDIYGTIDFIFGDATAIFQSCNIVVRQPLHGQTNPIVAQQRQCPNGKTGFTIQNCDISATMGHSNGTKTYLGRPWGKSTRVAFISNRFNVMIDPLGWLAWFGIPSQVYLGEFENTGLGANMTGRVAWPGVKRLTRAEAYAFTLEVLFNGGGWLDGTSVPYTRGLQ